MAPVLHMAMGSPPVRAVLMTANALDVKLDLKTWNLSAGEHVTEDFSTKNPARTIPTLDDDGFIVWESAAIMGYLVNKYGKDDALYPNDVKRRAVVDQLLHFSTSSFASFLSVFQPIIMGGRKKSTITQENVDRLFRSIEILEKLIGGQKYVTGDEITIADFSFICWVSSVNTGFPIKSDRFPNITAWWNRLEELPCYEPNREGSSSFASIWASRE